jgi:hypothetical protein
MGSYVTATEAVGQFTIGLTLLETMREPEISRPRSIVEAVCFVQPYYVLLVGLLPGFGLIFGSLILHIATWTASSPDFAAKDREVGYLPALNWSLTYALLFPIILYLMTNTISGLADAVDRLHSRGMVLKKDGLERMHTATLTSDWLAGSHGRSRLLIIFAVVIPTAFGVTEWFLNNFLRLVHMSQVPSHSDYDWGLAGLMTLPGRQEWCFIHRLANALFDLLAFTTEILLIGSLIAFFIAVLDLGRVVPSGRRGETLMLIPDIKSADRRLGFEVFADPLEKLLGVALVAYLVCYLVRLEGAYMASTTSSSLADFVSGDILSGIGQAAKSPTPSNLVVAFIALFSLGDQQIRGVLAWIMSVLVAVFSLSTVVMTVRGAAFSAHQNAVEGLENGSLPLANLDRVSAAKRLESMAVWPLGYLKLDLLLFWVSIAVLTLVLYRIGLFVAGIVSFSLFLRLIKRLLISGKDNKSAQQDDNSGG